ncbi:hypothetical protein BDA96_10G326600 [Sorghum bicolor]|uniref:Uncharacterized protein n=2 Tax=Sorghum bicolor TaxID=4558 RepID=A0A921Q859_SORBI|nr:hypothetical protein BDA96_10G326600 [Sorghum bicolor]OQU77000.1 hypothetical protein SORBI_3010G252550 [Sorghum bicolor]
MKPGRRDSNKSAANLPVDLSRTHMQRDDSSSLTCIEMYCIKYSNEEVSAGICHFSVENVPAGRLCSAWRTQFLYSSWPASRG